ncbi:omega-amidase, chloroplastic [Selaginella moellendorffii]|uniref:omega-amidase, chloroplastic n=1 Tax=Selaginella moellendorffii TaxID=88036 RepID=UPI000D1CC9C1|nr:omega-amidase, chloroplastic [Selaginella moellendorffii]|eukprot:XP_002985119.2 omega-amidase, chloroplastic [Selaginella moellendorffii]
MSSALFLRLPILARAGESLRRCAARSGVRDFASMQSDARKPPSQAPPEPPTSKFKLAVCQLSICADKEQNIRHAREAIQTAADGGSKLVLLPEMWNCPYSNASFPIYAEDIDAGDSPSSKMLSDMAKSKEVTIIGGSIPERSGNHLYNTCCIYGKDGSLKGKHRKVHLFDIDIPGKIQFKESDTLKPGDKYTVVDTDVGRIGVGICYDIRFPEMAMTYAARGVHMICYPGAFNMTTGPAHWELLQKARAVDNQLFVATCSPARNPSAGYVAWGHSSVIGPFGEILASTGREEAIFYADIDYAQIKERRMNMPLDHQRRGDLYQLVDLTLAT